MIHLLSRSRSNNPFTTIGLLVADIVVTSCLIVTAFLLFGSLLLAPDSPDAFGERLRISFGNLRGGLLLESPTAVFIYSTLFTSAWLWLYVLSGLLVRFAGSVAVHQKWLDIKQKPLYCMGLVAGPIAAVAWWLIALIQDFHFGPGTATVYTRSAPNSTSFHAEPCTSPLLVVARAGSTAHSR